MAAQKINKNFSIYTFHHHMIDTDENFTIRTVNRLQTKFKILQRNFCTVIMFFESSYRKFFTDSKKNVFLLSGFHYEQLIQKVEAI